MSSTDNAQLHTFTIDTDLQLKDAGLIAASAAAQVGGSDKILDLGDAFFEGQVLVDISAVEFDTADEKYEIMMQFSDVSDFSTGTPETFGIGFHLGDAQNGYQNNSAAGRMVMPFNNRYIDQTNGEVKNFRYMRLYTVISGTIATGIDYSAWVVKPNA